jgi:hypothetical protein
MYRAPTCGRRISCPCVSVRREVAGDARREVAGDAGVGGAEEEGGVKPPLQDAAGQGAGRQDAGTTGGKARG